jgi:hypothetical protein
LYLDGPSIDAAVVAAFFSALQPAELDILEEALEQARADQERWKAHYAEQVKRATYDAHLAQRQYQAVDPDNRLVAAELERRSEVALRALVEAQEAEHQFQATQALPVLDPVVRAQLTDVGRHLPALWASGQLTPEQQKEVLRSLIRRIILTRPRLDEVEAKVVWVSGAMTRLVIHPPVYLTRDLGNYDQLVTRIRGLSEQGTHDGEIARHLTLEGFRSARSSTVLPSLVKRVRQAEGIVSLTAQFCRQEKIGGCWTIWGLARALNVDRDWLYTRIQTGILPAQRHPLIGYYLIPDDPDLFKQLAEQVPSRR